jgi:hypothetical protein
MNKASLMIMDYMSEDPISIALLESEDAPLLLNKPPHNLKGSHLLMVIDNLVDNGLVIPKKQNARFLFDMDLSLNAK